MDKCCERFFSAKSVKVCRHRCLRFVLVTIQLGLQLQTGQDVSAVKDDVSAVKNNFDSVREGMDLYQASLTSVG